MNNILSKILYYFEQANDDTERNFAFLLSRDVIIKYFLKTDSEDFNYLFNNKVHKINCKKMLNNTNFKNSSNIGLFKRFLIDKYIIKIELTGNINKYCKCILKDKNLNKFIKDSKLKFLEISETNNIITKVLINHGNQNENSKIIKFTEDNISVNI